MERKKQQRSNLMILKKTEHEPIALTFSSIESKAIYAALQTFVLYANKKGIEVEGCRAYAVNSLSVRIHAAHNADPDAPAYEFELVPADVVVIVSLLKISLDAVQRGDGEEPDGYNEAANAALETVYRAVEGQVSKELSQGLRELEIE